MPSKPNTSDKAIIPVKNAEEILERLSGCKIGIDPDLVLKEVDQELSVKSSFRKESSSQTSLFKAMTLLEFENGILLSTVVPEQYQTFGIDLLRKLQKEYACVSPSEKGLAELATVNFIRTLAIQHRINKYLEQGSITDLGIKFLAVMGKELDRANKQYLLTIQALKLMKQPNLGFHITTETAIIGQNQLIQNNKTGKFT